MTHRAILIRYDSIQSTGITGTFDIIGTVQYFDDANTHVTMGTIYARFNYTMTGAQIQTAIVNDIINVGDAMGFTLAAGNNQIVIPTMAKV